MAPKKKVGTKKETGAEKRELEPEAETIAKKSKTKKTIPDDAAKEPPIKKEPTMKKEPKTIAPEELPATPRIESQKLIQKLKTMNSKGVTAPFDAYKNCKTQQEKRQFYKNYCLDPALSFCKVVEETTLADQETTDTVTGWMTIWEIQEIEKIPDLKLIEKMVEKLPSKDHDNPAAAAEGVKIYYYSKKMADRQSHMVSKTVTAKAEADVEGSEYEEVRAALQSEPSGSSKPRPKPRSKPLADTAQAQDPNEKKKDDLVAEYKKMDKVMGLELQQGHALVASAELAQSTNNRPHVALVLETVKASLVPFRAVHDNMLEKYNNFILQKPVDEQLEAFKSCLDAAKKHLEAFKFGAKADLKKLM